MIAGVEQLKVDVVAGGKRGVVDETHEGLFMLRERCC